MLTPALNHSHLDTPQLMLSARRRDLQLPETAENGWYRVAHIRLNPACTGGPKVACMTKSRLP